MSKKDQSFLEIDIDRLDEAWLDQPKLYHNYAVNLAEAKRELDDAKAKLDVVTAENQKDVSLNPVKYGLAKATVAQVDATVLLQQEVIDATQDVTECKYRVGILQAAVDALEHKKRALESLVQLANADYFATPRPPKTANGRELSERLQNKEKTHVRSKGRV